MNIIEIGKQVLEIEASSLSAAVEKIDENFERAVTILEKTEGRVIVTGMGKSGLIGRKIAATLSSVGCSSVFLHPSEALHGDLGMIKDGDSLIALSSSGKTFEVLRLLEYIKRIGIPMICLVGNISSTLAELSEVVLDCSVEKEACPFDMVPTTSTTLALAMGDALAVALMEKREFSAEDFRVFHPGGSLGKRLLTVGMVMHSGSDIPLVKPDDSIKRVITVIDEKRLGMAVIINDDRTPAGVVTDGDVRRMVLAGKDLEHGKAADSLNGAPKLVNREKLATEALKIMEDNRITSLVVTDEKSRVCGIVHLHDLWRTEMI